MILFSAVFLVSCEQKTDSKYLYAQGNLDIQDFFRNEILQLKKRNPEVRKTVIKNGESENKTIKIADWENEFSSFYNVDIHKPAYDGKFSIDSTDNQVVYKAKDKSTDIQYIDIKHDGIGSIYSIEIHRKTDNTLYNTEEKLFYIRNKEYKVEKTQSVWLLGTNEYRIYGEFINN